MSQKVNRYQNQSWAQKCSMEANFGGDIYYLWSVGPLLGNENHIIKEVSQFSHKALVVVTAMQSGAQERGSASLGAYATLSPFNARGEEGKQRSSADMKCRAHSKTHMDKGFGDTFP